MMDYNLFGMDWLHLLSNNNNSEKDISPSPLYNTLQLGVQFREPVPDQPKSIYSYNTQQSHNSNQLLPSQRETYTSATIPQDMKMNDIERSSYCELEIDTTVFMISNRLDILERDMHIYLNEQEKKSTINSNCNDKKWDVKNYNTSIINESNDKNESEKLVKSLSTVWNDELKRRKERGISLNISQPSQIFERSNLNNQWSVESDLRKKINKIVELEGNTNYQPNKKLLTNIMTVFKSVEALYPKEYDDFLKNIKIGDDDVKVSNINDKNNNQLNESILNTVNNEDKVIEEEVENGYNYVSVNDSIVTDIIANANNDIMISVKNEKNKQLEVENKDNDFSIILSPTSNLSPLQQRQHSSPLLPSNIKKNQNSSGLEATTPKVSNYYSNILATPSRFQQLEINTVADIDQDIINLLLQSNSFYDELDDDDENDRNDKERENNDQFLDDSMLERNETIIHSKNNEIESNEPEDHIHTLKRQYSIEMNDSLDEDIAKWFEESELQLNDVGRHKVGISYENEDEDKEFIIRPRKLNFASLAHEERQNTYTFKPVDDDNSGITNTQPLSISNLPPTLDLFNRKRKRINIPQVDGGDDEDDTEVNDADEKTQQKDKYIERIKRFRRLSYVAIPYMKVEKTPKFNGKRKKAPHQEKSNNISQNTDSLIVQSSARINSDDSLYYIEPSLMSTNSHKPSDDFLKNQSVSTKSQRQSYNGEYLKTEMRSTYKKIIDKDLSVFKKRSVPSSLSSPQSTQSFIYSIPPPLINDHKKKIVYQEPYYGKASDVPTITKVYGNKEFKLASRSKQQLKPFDPTPYGGQRFIPNEFYDSTLNVPSIRTWTPSTLPPTYDEVKEWKKNEKNVGNKLSHENKYINTNTQIKVLAQEKEFKFEHNEVKSKSNTKSQDLTDILSLEIHVNTRDDLFPDPEHDMVQVIFWCLKTNNRNISSNGFDDRYLTGVIAIDTINLKKIGINSIDIKYVKDEKHLILSLIDMVRYYDTDFLTGYELHNSSWGYLIERAQFHGINLTDQLSKVYCESQRTLLDPWGYRKASIFKIIGRHMLNVWRLLRNEIDLTSYTFANVVYTVLRHRVPEYSHRTLTDWYTKGAPILKNRLFRYYVNRVQMNIELLDASEVINRTTESARVFGIDFYSVITRGSQFKVESIMFRIAKPENYVLISPSRKQVGEQRAIECLPLIMEPISQYYSSPLLVLDFQSLYPSIMIAYNYCFSTCVGKIENNNEIKKFGVTELNLPDGLLGTLEDHLNVSPNGVAFVKPYIRKSLLAKMLEEILETRIMVKKSMKEYKDDPELLRILEAKQLTLKLIANVTFGYTAASFSGRMPAVEIADSIVQTGRETLEKTIKLINEHSKWGAKVVYSDTDSVFVYLHGKSKAEAFDIGDEIADTVSKMNPAPIKLKFEKVYHPCMLIAKKRYTGFKYEHRNQKEPDLEAKGIETVRRDGIPALQKIMKSCIHLLFETQDLSKIKEYLYGEWTKILSNRVPIQDFIIAKEVRLGTYKSLPHGARVAQGQMLKDPRTEPQYGERVPYVVVYQGPNAPLKDRVMNPLLLLKNRSLRLDTDYYIRKQIIAPLERIFQLIGVDIKSWYDEMPRSHKAMIFSSDQPYINEKHVNRIDRYYSSSYCIICKKLENKTICNDCTKNASQTIYTLLSRQRQAQKRLETALILCQNCTGLSIIDISAPELMVGKTGYIDMPCISMSCPVFYERSKACHDISVTNTYTPLIEKLSDSE
ncbi:unnamed protein product [Cunninghamella blakesleeana]